MRQMTVISGPVRRRRWSDEQKREVLAEAFGGDGRVSDVARRYELSTGLIYTWRRKLREERSAGGFVEAVVGGFDGPRAAGCETAMPVIIVEFAAGGRVSLSVEAPAALAEAVLRALR